VNWITSTVSSFWSTGSGNSIGPEIFFGVRCMSEDVKLFFSKRWGVVLGPSSTDEDDLSCNVLSSKIAFCLVSINFD
jgi:hypothetical protein